MAATFPIISERVKENGIVASKDAKRVQQLLFRAKHLQRQHIDGIWRKPSIDAWRAYQSAQGWTPNDYVDPTDAEDRLGWLAYDAGVLLYIAQGIRSMSALSNLVSSCIAEGIPYGWAGHGGGTKMAWGFENRTWAVIFTKPGSRKSAEFDIDSPDPRALNCCSFANIALSVWSRGDVHEKPYDSSQAVGGDGPQIGQRFGMPEVLNKQGQKVFSSLDDLKAVLKRDRIYHFALCRDQEGLFTKHDTVLVNDTIYQANVPAASPNRGAVYERDLDKAWQKLKVKRVRLFGPGPH